MTTLRTKITALAGFLLLVPAVATIVSANEFSDDQAINDWCTGVDTNKAASGGIQGDADICDADDPNTSAAIVSLGGNFINCTETSAAADGTATVCTDGADSFADTASGAGNFGGDYPIAENVVFTNVGPGAYWFNFRVCYIDVTQDPGLGSTCMDDFSTYPGVCLAAGDQREFLVTTTANNAAIPDSALTNPPFGTAGATIDAVYAFANIFFPVGSCGALTPGTRSVTFEWTYAAPASNNAAEVGSALGGIVCPPASGLTTSLDSVDIYCAAGIVGAGGTWSEANAFQYVIIGTYYDETVFGVSRTYANNVPGNAVVSNGATGVLACPAGGQSSTMSVATVWGIGETYFTAEAGPDSCT